GWIIDSDKRWIITNHHVVARRDGKVHAEVKIAFPEHKDGELITDVDYYERDDAALTRSGRILHADVRRDLAIVAVPTLPKGARALRVASKSARPGSTVYAVGNANGYDALWVLRKGTVHVVARTMEAKGRIYTVASDVALNPGDSGGPLVNEQCELVGVNFRGRGEHAKVAYSIDVRELKQFLADAPKIMAPESAGDFLLRARHHKDHRRFDDALADLDEALRLDDRSAEAYEEISWVHNEIGNYQEGMDAATRAIEINPRSSFAYNERAFAHEKRQEWANAVADLDKVVILDPKNGYAWAKLGRDLVNVRDHQRAVIVFNEAIRLHQKTGMVYEGRGDCYAALEEYANARADYEVALRLSPPGSIERERINDKLDELDRKIP
ncbi:MAG: serine protease, partial [Planctomycetes bacterium]|nr:serine protease [Planctomycetota bacterium]